MRLKLAVGLICLAAMGVCAQVATKYDAEITSTYTLPDSSVVKFEGVCRFNDTEISCWDPKGASAPHLAETIGAFYQGNSSQDLSFGFRKKNRLIVLSHTGANNGMNLSLADGQYMQTMQTNSGSNSYTLFWGLLKASPDANTARVIVQPGMYPVGQPTRIRFADGVKLDYGGISLELGGAKPLKPGDDRFGPTYWTNYGGLPQQGKLWNYFLSIRDPQQSRIFFQYTLIDKSGQKIEYVDREGNPVSALTYVKSQPAPSQPNYFPAGNQANPRQKYFQAMIQPAGTESDVTILRSNVNPDRVGDMEVSGQKQASLLLKDIPLDPK